MTEKHETKKRLLCYVSEAGRNKIADWYCDLSAAEQADADAFIAMVRKLKEWKMPDFKPLSAGLSELRWKSENKQHRLIGYFKAGAFVLLIGCTHKQQIYSPSDALETASKRKKNLEAGKGKVSDYDQLETDCKTEES